MKKSSFVHILVSAALAVFLLAESFGAAAASPAHPLPPYLKAHALKTGASPVASGTPLDGVLNPDGSLNLATTSHRSFDATGWSMVTGVDGQPRFVRPAGLDGTPTKHTPLTPNLAGDQWWSGAFLNGLSNGGASVQVYALAVAGSDVYVGGSFSQAGGIPANNIARWNSLTHRWYALRGGPQGQVYTIVPNGTSIYVGGSFNDLDGQSAWSLGRWDTLTQTWSLLGGSPGLSSSGTFVGVVQAMGLDTNGNLYVGGNFDHAGALAAHNIARLSSGGTWSALGNGLGLAGEVVLSLAVSGSDVFAGGSFTNPESYIAHWNGTSWSGMGGTNGPVLALALNGSNLYAGGQFITAGNVTVNHIGVWSGGTTWQDLGGGTDNDVTSILLGPGGYFVGGNFINAGSSTVNHLAVWTGSTWLGLGGGLDGEVYSLAVLGGDVYAGGVFNYATQADANSLAANNLGRWSSLSGSWFTLGNGVDGQVYAVAIDGNNVYIGGQFSSAGGVPVRNLAEWNSATGAWSDLGGGVAGCSAQLFCTTTVFAIAVNSSNVFVGGNFTQAGTVTASNLARWSNATQTWSAGFAAVCTGANCQTSVRTLSPYGIGVVAGGYFAQGGCTPVCLAANNIEYWDGNNSYSAFIDITTANNGTNDEVHTILYDGFGWYIGGLFSSPRSHLVYFDGSNFFGVASPLNATVNSLAEDANYLYVGGLFSNAGGNPAGNRIARLTMLGVGDWVPMGLGLDGNVLALAWSGSDLISGGRFTNSGLTGLSHIARWSTATETWSPVGSGMDNDINALAASNGLIYAGGIFLSAGGKTADYIARWAELSTYMPNLKHP